MKISNKIFISLLLLVMVGLTVLFNFLPRSTYSEVERRELAEFPTFDINRLLDGSWTKDLSSWYSDTEPYRDEFMTANMLIKGNMKLTLAHEDEEMLTFHATDTPAPTTQEESEATSAEPDSITPYVNHLNPDEEFTKIANSGILVVGKEPNARALMAFGASGKAGTEFAEIVNKYYDTFEGKVNVYCMAIPNAIEFYCPDKASKITKPQIATINNIYQLLAPGVKGIDCYTPLAKHASEDIFLRTDHHWAPLGAYYAAQAFASAAGVPFEDLSTYKQHVVHDFVGTMYGYSKDIAIKHSPEDFIYWTPTGVDYETTFIVYDVDKSMHVTRERKPYKGEFFAKFRDGSPSAYLTFMGGDQKITQVRTSTKNGRRLLILKDSFGNALPGYLFHSFEEIHVVDYRYFTRNLKDYVQDNGISDILFAHSIFMCLGQQATRTYNRFLNQNGKIAVEKEAPKPTKAKSENTGTPAAEPSVQLEAEPEIQAPEIPDET